MTPPGQNTTMQEALRRFLPRGNSVQTGHCETDPAVAQALAGKFAAGFSKYCAGTKCRPIGKTRDVSGEDQTADFVTLAFNAHESGPIAWVELPVALIKLLFVASLGGFPSSASFPPKEPLTKIERRFVAIVAGDIADALAFSTDPAVLARTFFPGETELPAMPDNFGTISLLVSVNGVEVEVAIHLPLSKLRAEIAPADVSTLAGTTARLFVEPEIRLRLRGMALSDIAKLKQGDILSVAPEATGMAACLAVHGNAVIACELGQIGKRYSARVIGPLTALAEQMKTNLERGGH